MSKGYKLKNHRISNLESTLTGNQKTLKTSTEPNIVRMWRNENFHALLLVLYNLVRLGLKVQTLKPLCYSWHSVRDNS